MNEKELITIADQDIDILKGKFDIIGLEKACLKLEQIEFPVEHTFADGVYVRTMKGTKGAFAIGKRHRYQTVNIITKGRALIYNGDGLPAKEIIAPSTFISGPYVKKAAFFLEDTEWVNVHATKETDLEKIESECIITEESYALMIEEQTKIEGDA